jgi:hypothetical protein
MSGGDAAGEFLDLHECLELVHKDDDLAVFLNYTLSSLAHNVDHVHQEISFILIEGCDPDDDLLVEYVVFPGIEVPDQGINHQVADLELLFVLAGVQVLVLE